jgi:hypothetical protein
MALLTPLPGPRALRVEARYEMMLRTRVARLDARHVENSSRGHEAQIEIDLSSYKTTGGPSRSECFSLVLTPAEARALALAICPELGS